MNGQIFISYRRDDTHGVTGRIYDRLLNSFERDQIFMDVDTISPGEDFVEAIEKAVSKCDIELVVIGKNWVTISRKGQRMLDNPLDFVRTEIRTALKRKIPIIPVLVENVLMPDINELPDDIKPLSRKNAIEISHTRFNSDADRLIKSIQKIFADTQANARAQQEEKQEQEKQAQILRLQQENERKRKEQDEKLKKEQEGRWFKQIASETTNIQQKVSTNTEGKIGQDEEKPTIPLYIGFSVIVSLGLSWILKASEVIKDFGYCFFITMVVCIALGIINYFQGKFK
jgi:hypothetical protein